MVRIKICGITRPADAAVAADLGADAIGLVFARSPRQVSLRQAARIIAALPPYVSAVGVFVNAPASAILRAVQAVGLSEVQLHGEEPPDFRKRLDGVRVIRAIRVRSRTFLGELAQASGMGANGLLLDAFSAKARGGTGKRFDWDLIVGLRRAGALDDAPPIILAGGLTPQNVAAGIRKVRPWGVDVSSGVEERPGAKSAERMERFVRAARGA